MHWYDEFDEWTKRTGILDGSGLTWMLRIPVDILLYIIILLQEATKWVVRGLHHERTD